MYVFNVSTFWPETADDRSIPIEYFKNESE